MTLIRKKGSKANNKKIATVDLEETTKLKTTMVSSIVKQLADQGYKGDIMSHADLGATRIDSDISNNDANIYNEDQMIGDIDFDTSEPEPEEVMVESGPSPKEKRKNHEKKVEVRTANSKSQIDDIQGKAKFLYSDIDKFINGLREAASNAPDNPYLCRKFENIRKQCIGFVNSVQQQLPRTPASLFVNVEEDGK